MSHPFRSRVRSWAVAAGVVAAAAVAARARGPLADDLVTRTYPVADLVHTPIRPAGPTADGDGAPPNLTAPDAQRDGDDAAAVSARADELGLLIQRTIDPAGWAASGGAGRVSVLGDVLVVTQGSADQRAIADLLADLRRSSGRDAMVRIDAAWLLLTPAEMAAAPATPAPFPTPANLYCQARVVGFNGQTQSVTAQRASTVVTGLTPVVATGVAVWDPTLTAARSGVTLTVTPRLSGERAGVTVDVDSAVTAAVPRPDPVLTAPATRPADGGDLSAQGLRDFAARPDSTQQQFRTTVRLRPDVPMLVGGMTAQPGPAGDHRSLCLVLTAHVEPAATTRPADRAP